MLRAPVVSISHGGGPLPLLGDPIHASLTHSLKNRIPDILRLATSPPSAIIVVTAHWEEAKPTISSGAKHALLYDYGGFPPESYNLNYDAPGSPSLAAQIQHSLQQHGFSPRLDPTRGWDHGVFVPFLLINPAANIPIVQMSVLKNQDAAAHFRLGRALAPFREQNVAIVGSGFASMHHLPNMFRLMNNSGDTSLLKNKSAAWSDALSSAVLNPDRATRETALTNWRDFPNSYDMHPRNAAEHLLPLLVCAAAAGDEQAHAFKDDFAGVDVWSYYWP